MYNLEHGWCPKCNEYKWSGSEGIFQRRYTGKCLHCKTVLISAEKHSRANSTTESYTPSVDFPSSTNTSFDTSDNSFSGNGGSFGGGGASSSWDSSDSSSSSSDSGSSSSSD